MCAIDASRDADRAYHAMFLLRSPCGAIRLEFNLDALDAIYGIPGIGPVNVWCCHARN